MKFYFTFGFGQVHENGYHIIEAKDYASARKGYPEAMQDMEKTKAKETLNI